MSSPHAQSASRFLVALLVLGASACPQTEPDTCVRDADCDDGAYCNGPELCGEDGRCTPGTPPELDDGRSCTMDRCDEDTDRVDHDASACAACALDADCDDGAFCNGPERCDQGLCLAGTAPRLDDGIACTVDACDESADQVTHDASACQTVCGDGTQAASEACDDGNAEAGDGCDPTCAVEAGWHCQAGSSERCVLAIDSCIGAPDLTPCELVTSPDRAYDLCSEGACVSPGCGGTAECNVPSPTFRTGEASPRWQREAATDEPVVLDLGTGLAWQGCLRGLSGSDCTEGTALTSPWADAVSHCDALTWGGKDDWRLPSDFELRSMLDYRPDIPFDTGVFPGTRGQSELILWSSTWTAATSGVTTVLFTGASPGHDLTFVDPVERAWYARCVRTARQTLPPVQERFSRTEPVAEEPIVADAITGLTWQGCQAGKSGASCAGSVSVRAHAAAVTYCSGLEWGAFDDWRLPAVDELRSIYEPRRRESTQGAVDPLVFPNTQPGLTWTSTADSIFSSSALQVRFDYRLVSSTPKGTELLVRCVR